MRPAIKEDFRPLLQLISLGVVSAATVGGFFGVGFIWLTDRYPAASLAGQVPSAQPLELPEAPPPVDNSTAWGQSTAAARTAGSTLPGSDALLVIQQGVSPVPDSRVTPAGSVICWLDKNEAQ